MNGYYNNMYGMDQQPTATWAYAREQAGLPVPPAGFRQDATHPQSASPCAKTGPAFAAGPAPAASGTPMASGTFAAGPAPTGNQAPAANQAFASNQAPAVGPAPADHRQTPPASRDPQAGNAGAFTAVSALFLIVGLLLLGAAIVPLLSYFDVTPAQSYFVGLGYLAVLSLVLSYMTSHLIFTAPSQAKAARFTRMAVLVATELAVATLAANSDFQFRWEATLVAIALIVLAMRTVVGPEIVNRSYLPLRINEIAVWFVMVPIVSSAQIDPATHSPHVASAVCYGIVLASAFALAALRTRELSSPDSHPLARNAALTSLTAIVIPLLAASYLLGCTPLSYNEYALDSILMVGALASSAIGFKYSSTALRHTGLVTLLLVIAKMATVDTIGLDPVGRAVAYLVGGAVCVATGMLYSYATKKLATGPDSEPGSELGSELGCGRPTA